MKLDIQRVGCLAVLILVVIAALGVLAAGWVVMIAFGALHSVIPGVPALGYEASVLVYIALAFLGAVLL